MPSCVRRHRWHHFGGWMPTALELSEEVTDVHHVPGSLKSLVNRVCSTLSLCFQPTESDLEVGSRRLLQRHHVSSRRWLANGGRECGSFCSGTAAVHAHFFGQSSSAQHFSTTHVVVFKHCSWTTFASRVSGRQAVIALALFEWCIGWIGFDSSRKMHGCCCWVLPLCVGSR